MQSALEKVDARAGDGTTSAAIFIKSLYDSCRELLQTGKVSLPELRGQLKIGVQHAVQLVNSRSEQPNDKQLLQLAQTSANSAELGKLVYDAAKQSKFV